MDTQIFWNVTPWG